MTFSKPLCVAFSLVMAGIAPSAEAQTRSDAFLQALSHVPADQIRGDGDRNLQVEFGDFRPVLPVAMMQALTGDLALSPEFMALGRILPGDMRELVLARGRDGALEGAIGVGPTGFETVLRALYGRNAATVMVLRDGAGADMANAMRGNGYAEDARSGTDALWRGAEDRAMDRNARDPADPFGRNMGLSSRVVIDGDQVFQAADWPMIEAMTASDMPSLADDPSISAVAMALASEGAGQGALAQVVLMQDPAGAVTAIGDIVNGVNLSGVLAVSAPDTGAAEAIAAAMARNWTEAESYAARGEPYATLFAGAPVIITHPGTPAVVTLRIDGMADFTDRLFQNPVAYRFYSMMAMDDLGPLITP